MSRTGPWSKRVGFDCLPPNRRAVLDALIYGPDQRLRRNVTRYPNLPDGTPVRISPRWGC